MKRVMQRSHLVLFHDPGAAVIRSVSHAEGATVKIRIRKSNFLYRNNIVWVIPYLLFLIVFNFLAAWALLDLTGLGWVPPFRMPTGVEFFAGDRPGKWIAFPGAGLALIEHVLLKGLVEVVE